MLIPSEALIVRADGVRVALVRPDHTVHLQKIQIGRDYGDRVEIVQGIQEGATILASPGDVSEDGTKIVPITKGDAQL